MLATSAGKFPALRLGNAIAKVLAEETPVARAYETVHSAYYPAYAVAKAKPAAGDAPVGRRDEDEEDVADEEEEAKDEKENRRSTC